MIFLTLAASSSPSLTMIKFSNLDTNYKIMVNYNGQADLLLSLQIPPDYYPYQFKQRSLYDYLTNIKKYIVSDSNTSETKKSLANKIQQRLDQLIGQIKDFGPSLWNEDLYEGGLVSKNEQMWSSKSANYLFLEQFVLDDSADTLFLTGGLPKHKNLIVTNFRAARDPYTLFNEQVFKYFLDKSSGTNQGNNGGDSSQDQNKKIGEQLYKYYQGYSKLKPDTLYRTAKYMNFWNSFCSTLNSLNSNEGSTNGTNGKISDLFILPAEKKKFLFLFLNQLMVNNSWEKLIKL
ncbi:hypothetical protein [Mycoplasma suis]|uniref:hypothetical protein n=1 Tax=Mycoplasma suis TaxID=57372 RepID=UPI0003153813|nr:hypothetical protein [Mycoplasma suis]